MPSLWSGCKVQKRDSLPHNIDGDCVSELPYDNDKLRLGLAYVPLCHGTWAPTGTSNGPLTIVVLFPYL